MPTTATPRFGLIERALGRLHWQDARCLYILSTGRTGTTSLEKLLKLIPEMAVYHELPPIGAVSTIEALHHLHETPERFSRYFKQHRASIIGVHHRRDEVFVETNNFAFLAPVIVDLLPNSRFVHLYRHPADYVRSGMRRKWYAGHNWDQYRLRPAEDDPHFSQWESWTPFEKICWFWTAANRTFRQFCETQPAERVASVKFEELFDGESSVYRRFFEVLGIDPPAEDAARELLASPKNAQEAGEFPLYADWSGEQRRMLKEIAGDEMARLGYE